MAGKNDELLKNIDKILEDCKELRFDIETAKNKRS